MKEVIYAYGEWNKITLNIFLLSWHNKIFKRRQEEFEFPHEREKIHFENNTGKFRWTYLEKIGTICQNKVINIVVVKIINIRVQCSKSA